MEDLDQMGYTLFSSSGVCIKISCADRISQGLCYPLTAPAAPSLQDRLAFSYLFARDCISTKNSAKSKNTTVCLIVRVAQIHQEKGNQS